jgi:biofilm PGA synthesis N-glycosyltransferase PgaC
MLDTIISYIGWAFIVYGILYTSSKVFFSLFSLNMIRSYTDKYDHFATEEELIEHTKANGSGREIPKISIIVPAYNEGALILDTSKSYIEQSYVNSEVIICSDGGTDGTLDILIDEYDLFEVEDTFTHSENISHQPIKRFFKSKKYDHLIVLDKVNGGKADAQNAGISIASGEVVCIIDADSILERNALYHLADIFEREDGVIGIGTPIGVLNDSNVGDDGVEDGSMPKSFWARTQVLEYLRSFLLGRMALQKFKGLALVSGAFGVYQKWIVDEVGGYTSGSLAEDMDIDCKIWRHLSDKKLDDLKIIYIPEVFCWSEVPNDFKNLKSQRDRWSRGLTETILKNKDLFFNPKRGVLGMFAYPYYVFFEWFTPFVEMLGLFMFPFLVGMGLLDFEVLSRIFILYYITGLSINLLTIYVESRTGGHYKDNSSLRKLGLVAAIEPLFYHWVNSFIYVFGNVRLIFGVKGWGKMERKGLKK